MNKLIDAFSNLKYIVVKEIEQILTFTNTWEDDKDAEVPKQEGA